MKVHQRVHSNVRSIKDDDTPTDEDANDDEKAEAPKLTISERISNAFKALWQKFIGLFGYAAVAAN